jgi:hypothetical protein
MRILTNILNRSLLLLILVTIGLLTSLSGYTSTTANTVVQIKPLGEQELKQFYSLFNLPKNKSIKFANLPKSISIKFGTYEFDNDYDYELYKLDINNSGHSFYVLTRDYSSGDSIGTSGIDSIYEVTPDNKITRLNAQQIISLTSPHDGIYTNIDGFSYCGAKVCADFSVRPSNQWGESLG